MLLLEVTLQECRLLDIPEVLLQVRGAQIFRDLFSLGGLVVR